MSNEGWNNSENNNNNNDYDNYGTFELIVTLVGGIGTVLVLLVLWKPQIFCINTYSTSRNYPMGSNYDDADQDAIERGERIRNKRLIRKLLIVKQWKSIASSTKHHQQQQQNQKPKQEHVLIPQDDPSCHSGTVQNEDDEVNQQQPADPPGERETMIVNLAENKIANKDKTTPKNEETQSRLASETTETPQYSGSFPDNTTPPTAEKQPHMDVVTVTVTVTATDNRLPSQDEEAAICNDAQDIDDESESCAICLEPFQNEDQVCQSNNKNCSHTFHVSCMTTWMTQISSKRRQERSDQQDKESPYESCPLCRQDYFVTKPSIALEY